jgi:hypothetical protein
LAKKTRRIGNGGKVMPLQLHVEKVGEQRNALKKEMDERLVLSGSTSKEQGECDDVEAISLRELSVEQREELRRSVMMWKRFL